MITVTITIEEIKSNKLCIDMHCEPVGADDKVFGTNLELEALGNVQIGLRATAIYLAKPGSLELIEGAHIEQAVAAMLNRHTKE